MRIFIALLGVLLFTGCQSTGHVLGKSDPRSSWWELTFLEPNYMQVWVEDSSVQDINGKVFLRAGSGTAAGGEPEDGKASARGWVGVGGSGKTVVGADLPKRIFVRWQSIAEQKTYRAWVDIPDEARQLMESSTAQRCPETPEKEARFMATVYLGLAPGGVIQAWVKDSCYRPIKVARAQAELEPLGPDQGKNDGRYAYPVSEKSKRYINQYGIPYGSW
ncbi:DUF2931 family protein [Pseudomonas frederiksbergensis]|uniref:DUF2931 family protein n=1 Tax=Pseudomonas frederiksbergensis TaxID=104087 RepID=UPI000F490328|nr:DUF2931 family protein [Pseudomonas frederiksbergensis]RON43683.1 hypothetical protein BK667_28455 [Pseudomonas frederiksbergensis]